MPQAVFIVQDQHLASTLAANSPTLLDDDKSYIPVKHVEIFSLPHPKFSDNLAKYVYINGTILEVQTVQHEDKDNYPGCWFIADSIENHGALYLCSKVDLLFMALPYFYTKFVSKKTTTFTSLSEIVPAGYVLKALTALPHTLLVQKLGNICDVSDLGDMTSFKLNKDKLFGWLHRGVAKVCHAIVKSQHITPIDLVPNPNTTIDDQFSVRESWCSAATYVMVQALGFVGEYINDALLQDLLATYKDDNGAAFSGDMLKKNKKSSGLVTGDKEIVNEEQQKRKDQPALVEVKKKAKNTDPKGSKLITSFFKKL